jgi:hypothetical protein
MPIEVLMGSAPLGEDATTCPASRCDDVFDYGVSQGFLAGEMIVKCSLGDPSGGQDCVEAGTLKTRFVSLPKCRLQQELPLALRIA